MMPERRHARPLRRYGNAAAALLASIARPRAARGRSEDDSRARARPGARPRRVGVGGRRRSCQVRRPCPCRGCPRPRGCRSASRASPSVTAATDTDAFWRSGTCTRRSGSRSSTWSGASRRGGWRSSRVSSGVASDKFELRLGPDPDRAAGVGRDAEVQPGRAGAGRVLPRGQRLPGSVRASGHWPAVYALAGVYPANWTPADSLLVQRCAHPAAGLQHRAAGLRGAARSLGAQHDQPVVRGAAAGQSAASLGSRPVQDRLGTAALTSASEPAAGTPVPRRHRCVSRYRHGGRRDPGRDGRVARGADPHLADSNAWAVNGPKVAGGGAMLAGDPHLLQTLPSIWYEVGAAARPGCRSPG